MMDLLVSTAWAQDAAAQPEGAAGVIGTFMPLIIIFIIFYVLIFRPQMKQQKQRKAMLDDLKRGDEVISNGGIYGKIVELQETWIMLQIANNVTIKLDRSQILGLQSQAETKS